MEPYLCWFDLRLRAAGADRERRKRKPRVRRESKAFPKPIIVAVCRVKWHGASLKAGWDSAVIPVTRKPFRCRAALWHFMAPCDVSCRGPGAGGLTPTRSPPLRRWHPGEALV